MKASTKESLRMDKAGIQENFSIEGRVAVVTGGSRGIGLAISKAFASAGAKVVVASRKLETCEQAVAEIEADGGEALAVAAHMGELDDLDRLVKEAADRFGGVDILINNAANALAMPFAEMTEAAWEKSFAVNLKGPVFLTQKFLPYLEKSKHASVVNVSSVAGFIFAGSMHMYAAGKSALQSYTRSLAGELAPHNIRVNCIAPGTVDTDMVRNTSPEQQVSMAEASFMKRAAHPDEIVGLALYLASDASSFMTGTTINIDGGGLVAR